LTTSKPDEHRISINIAGFPLLLQTENANLARRLRQRYVDFLVEDAVPLLTLELQIAPGAVFIPLAPGPWIIESDYQETRLTYRSYLEEGEVDWASGRGRLSMHENAHIENFLRVIYAWLCLQDGGLLLHAAGLIRNGEGYVFFGPSGAGKTTTTRLSQDEAIILSDDLVILRPRGDHVRLFGVPFKGELSAAPRANQEAPLKAIYRLRQDDRHAVVPLAHTRAVAELVASAPFVVRDRKLSQQLMSVCDTLARQARVHELRFRRDKGFWKAIDEYNQGIPTTTSANGRARL
jgi:hypothetical protein